jgi:hypothetical protein
MLHYYPRHVSNINMPIFRRTNCIITASGIVTVCIYSTPDESRLASNAAARKPDTQPSAPHCTDNLKTKAPNTTGSNYLYNTLELLMMGTVVPETCWASNKICNKNHLLHLVGILFPHIDTHLSLVNICHVVGTCTCTSTGRLSVPHWLSFNVM